MNKKSKMPVLLVFLLALLLCIGSAIYIGKTLYVSNHEKETYEAISSEAAKEDTELVPDTDLVKDMADETGVPENIIRDAMKDLIDFDVLKERNDELVSWIRVPQTNIDYPVAMRRSEDQAFYLDHDMDRQEAYAGCIYMEYYNSEEFTDFNSIIYGHNMKNGTMFKTLHLFEEKDFFDKQRYFYIYIPDHVLIYEIFAAYDVDDSHILTANDFFKDTESREKYISDIGSSRSMTSNRIDQPGLTAESRIVTLSTCIGGQPDRRFIVQGVLRADVR